MPQHRSPMTEPTRASEPPRIASRADIEFQLARLTLSLSRAPMVRHEALSAWFDEAVDGLEAMTTEPLRGYLQERAGEIRCTFFPGDGCTGRLH